MKIDSAFKKAEKSLLEILADQVQDLHLKAQVALPIDRIKIIALYRKAFLTYHAHKIFVAEQDALLLATGR